MAQIPAGQFFVKLAGVEQGPLTREEVEDLHGARQINRTTPCRTSDDSRWLTVYDLVPSAIWVSSPRSTPEHLLKVSRSIETGPTFTSSTWFRITSHAVGLIIFLIAFNALLDAMYPPPAESSRQRYNKLMQSAPKPLRADPNNPFAGFEQGLKDSVKHMERTLDYASAELKEIDRQFQRDLVTWVVLGAIGFVFWLWMLLAVSLREPPGSEKIVWVLIIVLTGPLGAAIYYFARYPALPTAHAQGS